MKYRTIKIALLILIVFVSCVGGYAWYDRGRPAPVPVKQKLYEGVTYRRIVRLLPRPMIAHLVTVDTKSSGMTFLVTPPDSGDDQPLQARTTSQFLEEFELQLAVNGDGFFPWWSNSPADYYPHVGDLITPLGFTASNGNIYWNGENAGDIGIEPTLSISRRTGLSFTNRPDKVYSAISGDRMLLEKGEVVPGLGDEELDPRTALGINRNGRYLYILVIDGRQPFYSDGSTFQELAALLKAQGAYYAMSLDGGGSSTLVIENKDGLPQILNSPIDNYIPGRERPVGNHLGIYINR